MRQKIIMVAAIIAILTLSGAITSKTSTNLVNNPTLYYYANGNDDSSPTIDPDPILFPSGAYILS